MICPRCGRDNPPGARFCTDCRCPLTHSRQWERRQGWDRELGAISGERWPRSGRIKLIIVLEAVLLIILLIFFWLVGSSVTGPKRTLERYWEAREKGNWNQVYEYCDIPESDCLTRQMFVDATRNFPAVKSWDIGASRMDGKDRIYSVRYEKEGRASEGEIDGEMTLIPAGRKWGIFQRWKVHDESLLVEDISFYLPEDSEFWLNGEQVESREKEESQGTVPLHFPWLFAGDYQVQVTGEGMETYRMNLSLSFSDGGLRHEVVLRPSRELETELTERSGSALQLLLQNALTGQDFGTVSQLFTEEAVEDGTAAEEYNAIKGIRSDGRVEGVTFLEIYELEGQIPMGQKVGAGRVPMKVKGYGKKRYVSEYMGRLVQDISEGVLQLQFDYVKENGQWRLARMPITEEDIRYI